MALKEKVKDNNIRFVLGYITRGVVCIDGTDFHMSVKEAIDCGCFDPTNETSVMLEIKVLNVHKGISPDDIPVEPMKSFKLTK